MIRQRTRQNQVNRARRWLNIEPIREVILEMVATLSGSDKRLSKPAPAALLEASNAAGGFLIVYPRRQAAIDIQGRRRFKHPAAKPVEADVGHVILVKQVVDADKGLELQSGQPQRVSRS